MAELKTTHHGYTIRFSENEDLWNCYDLGFEHKSLQKLKLRINKWMKDRLDSANIVVAFRDGYSYDEYKLATVVGAVSDEPGTFWILLDKEDKRRKVKLSLLFPWTDELVAALKAKSEKLAEADRLRREANEEFKKYKPSASETEALRAKITGVRTIEE